VRVLNEKYIPAQQKNNNNRTNPMTHIYIFYLSSLQLIEFEERDREEKEAEARITRERKWFFSERYKQTFFLILLLLLPLLCAIT
jgi:hypothetical protein